MKQKDIALILVIAFFGAILALVTSNLVFGSSQSRQQEVEVVEPISANFPTPDQRYFNSKSINPTQLIEIGNNHNTDPFSGSGQ
jgi:hypothetical protein